MIPIPLLGSVSSGQAALTLLTALASALVVWWMDRRLLGKHDDPALPELLASRRRANVRIMAFAVALMIMLGGGDAAWGIPLFIALMIAAAYPIRTRILGETWSFGSYLRHTALSVAGGFGFWIALGYMPTVVHAIAARVGQERWWLAILLSLVPVALLFAWEAWYPSLWLWTHAGEPLVSEVLTPRFDEIVRRAATVEPRVYRVGPQGSRFVNAVALPSVRRPSVAMGTALLDLLDVDETVAIFAHEIAHFDHFTRRRVRRNQLTNRALIVTGAALALVATFANVEWAQWIWWLWPFLVIAALVRRAAKSQQHETESDLRAAALCGDPEALVRGLVKLHLHARIPRRYAVDMERAASHPSLVRRIQAIRAGGPQAIEELGAPTVIRTAREGSWVVLDDMRSYWLDGVPDGTTAELAALRDAASSYRAVNYRDLVELRVAATGDARSLTARGRGGDAWNVPLAADDVARVQRSLDVVDLRLGKAGPAPAPGTPKFIAILALAVSMLAGQAGIVLVPIVIALWKPAPAALAALGAMSIVRAVLGGLAGSGWFDENVVRLGLVAMAGVGIAAIYVAVRLVRAGQGKDHQRLTMSVLVAVAAIVAVVTVWQVVTLPTASIIGAAILGTLGTALAGVAGALFTVQARWSRRAGYAGLVAAAATATVGVDRSALRLEHALSEGMAQGTQVSETDLDAAAQGLRVSPNGMFFLAARMQTGRRASGRSAESLLAGRVGEKAREVPAISGDFLDDESMLLLDVLERGVELRLERVDGNGPPLWVDTIADLDLVDPRLTLERDTRTWSIVGEDTNNDRTAVVMGKIGEHGSPRRAAIPDTIAMVGEPIVFGATSAVIVPSFRNTLRAAPVSLWSIFGGLDAFRTDLWRVRGDSVRRIGSLQGPSQCGQPLGGAAACSSQRRNGTSLYAVDASGTATEIARLPSQNVGVVTLGPGLEATSMTYNRDVLMIDLTTRRLTRVSLPPNSQFGSEVRSGAGWAVTLGYAENRRSTVRLYRVTGR